MHGLRWVPRVTKTAHVELKRERVHAPIDRVRAVIEVRLDEAAALRTAGAYPRALLTSP